MTFIHVLPSHQVKSEQGYYPKQKPRSLPQTPPVSQKYIKCWCVIWGRPKGLRALSLDQCSGRGGPCSGRGRADQPGSQRQGGRANQPPLGAGKTHAVLGRKEPERKLAVWSPTRVEGGGWVGGWCVMCTPGGRGGIGETLGNSENGTAPPALILADLQASPSGHLKYLPHPFLGLG